MPIENGMILIFNEDTKEYICKFPHEHKAGKLPEKTVMYYDDWWKPVKLVNNQYEYNEDFNNGVLYEK